MFHVPCTGLNRSLPGVSDKTSQESEGAIVRLVEGTVRVVKYRWRVDFDYRSFDRSPTRDA